MMINEDVYNILPRSFDLNHRNVYIGHQSPVSVATFIREKKPMNILQFVVSGHGGFHLEGHGFYTIKKGSIFYLPKGELVSYWPNSSDPYEYYYLAFDVLERDDFFKQIGFSLENPVANTEDERIFDAIKNVYDGFKLQSTAGCFNALSEIYKIFSLLTKQNNKPQSPSFVGTNSYMERAIVFINNNYGDDLNVNSIADELNLNRSYFSVMFKKYTGVSPLQYLTELRVAQACKLLAMDKTVTEVALLTGFNSPTTFGVHFKALVKMTPLEYKKYIRGK